MSSTASPGCEIVAVVLDRCDSCSADDGAGQEAGSRDGEALAVSATRSGGGADVGLRQVEGEGAALAGRAAQLDFAAEQAGQFAADGQAQAGAAVLAAGAGVGLLEGLEDDALLFRRDADAGVGDLEGDDGTGAGRGSDDRRSSRLARWRR